MDGGIVTQNHKLEKTYSKVWASGNTTKTKILDIRLKKQKAAISLSKIAKKSESRVAYRRKIFSDINSIFHIQGIASVITTVEKSLYCELCKKKI